MSPSSFSAYGGDTVDKNQEQSHMLDVRGVQYLSKRN